MATASSMATIAGGSVVVSHQQVLKNGSQACAACSTVFAVPSLPARPDRPHQQKGAPFSKLSSSLRFNDFSSVKLQRLIPQAASSVQQESGTVSPQTQVPTTPTLEFTGVHHVGVLCENLEQSLEFYQGVLGLKINPDRPEDKLPYRGAWFWVGEEMIHIMELPNPDPQSGRPAHGGRDRHTCVAIKSLDGLKIALENAGIPYTSSKSGRAAIFARDPDGNCLEFTLA